MTTPRITARYKGHCKHCGKTIEPGQLILWQAPNKAHARALTVHDQCARDHHAKKFPTDPDAWRKNRSWMTAEEFSVLEEVMAKQLKPTGPIVGPKPRGYVSPPSGLDAELDAHLAREP